MTTDPSFVVLLDRLRRGDQDAAQQIFHRFARRLIGLARTRLSPAVRQKVDPEDVMQSVFKSFFRRDNDEHFDLEGWDSLWSLLTVITLRKCGYRTRHFRAARRDVEREVSPQPDPDDSSAEWEAIAREPTPVEEALLTETVEQLFRGLDERDRRIVELSLQGYKPPEISDQLGIAERTVYRQLERVKGRLERLGADDASRSDSAEPPANG
jgi:RNA polymerase sigma-70 factor, ECF subfamily